MSKIEEAKKNLQQKINRLKEKEAKIKIAERKQRTRRLIELGGLVEKAEISDLTTAQLFGAFLQIKDQSKDEKVLISWAKTGETEFNRNKGSMNNEKPILIKFPSEPDAAIRKKLRSFGIRWNSVRKEWEGVADPDAIKVTFIGVEMMLQEILAT
jgi:Conjugal transfer protein TraD